MRQNSLRLPPARLLSDPIFFFTAIYRVSAELVFNGRLTPSCQGTAISFDRRLLAIIGCRFPAIDDVRFSRGPLFLD
jgi:hypothetical protein